MNKIRKNVGLMLGMFFVLIILLSSCDTNDSAMDDSSAVPVVKGPAFVLFYTEN